MNQDELREFAECEGGAFGECDPADSRWSWRVEAFDVARVVEGPLTGRPMDRKAWLQWLDEEISAGIRGGGAYFDRLATALRETPDVFEPVIVAVHPDGRIEIGDGWHRFAISVRDGIATLKAVVGTWDAN